MVRLVYSNLQPFYLPDAPFPPPMERGEYLRAWRNALPSDSELGAWTVAILDEDVVKKDESETDCEMLHLGETPFWRAYPIELAVRLQRILYCRHADDEALTRELHALITKHFPEFTGALRWEHYYLDWGYGSSDVTFELELPSHDSINKDLRRRFTDFYDRLLLWRNKFSYARLQGHSPGLRNASPAANTLDAPSVLGVTKVYADYFALRSEADDTAAHEAFERLTGDTITKVAELEPGLTAMTMAKGEYAFVLSSEEAICRSRNLCSTGVVLYDAIQALGTSAGNIPQLRRNIVGSRTRGPRVYQHALARLNEAELRVVELGSIARPVRFTGDEFEERIYEAFWDTQSGEETLLTAESEIRQTKTLMEAPVAAHFERQQWRLSLVGYFIATLGLAGAIKDFSETAISMQFLSGLITPSFILATQLLLIVAASIVGYAFFRR